MAGISTGGVYVCANDGKKRRHATGLQLNVLPFVLSVYSACYYNQLYHGECVLNPVGWDPETAIQRETIEARKRVIGGDVIIANPLLSDRVDCPKPEPSQSNPCGKVTEEAMDIQLELNFCSVAPFRCIIELDIQKRITVKIEVLSNSTHCNETPSVRNSLPLRRVQCAQTSLGSVVCPELLRLLFTLFTFRW